MNPGLRWFVAFFHFTSWAHFSLGLSVCLDPFNVEVHIPFGFFKLGWGKYSRIAKRCESMKAGYDGSPACLNKKQKWSFFGMGMK